jgi:hypothetical protein
LKPNSRNWATVKVIAMANARIHVKLRIVIQIGWSTLFIVAQEIVWSVSTKVRD